MSKVTIVEMGLRDGLQNEAVHFSLSQRMQLTKKLVESGLSRIEVGAFVSPRWVPQMSQTPELVHRILKSMEQKKISSSLQISALVPNVRGMESAVASKTPEVAIFGAVSETFSQKNINASVKESFQRFRSVASLAKKHKIKLRAYLSTVFGCPYEGKVSTARVLKSVERMLELGVREISLGDTIGVANPRQVRTILNKVSKMVDHHKVALHFHDTRGTALANILASLDLGYRIFDSSIGGLGGCPYAPGAAGNVATEDVVYMLDGMGMKTGVDLEKLIKTTLWMNRQLGRALPSKLSLAGVR